MDGYSVTQRMGQIAVGMLYLWSIAYGQTADSERLSLSDDPFYYSAQYTDSESNQQYLLARYYDPRLMRFASRDTVNLTNRYGYGNANPIMNVDPSGNVGIGLVAGLFLSMVMPEELSLEEIIDQLINEARALPDIADDTNIAGHTMPILPLALNSQAEFGVSSSESINPLGLDPKIEFGISHSELEALHESKGIVPDGTNIWRPFAHNVSIDPYKAHYLLQLGQEQEFAVSNEVIENSETIHVTDINSLRSGVNGGRYLNRLEIIVPNYPNQTTMYVHGSVKIMTMGRYTWIPLEFNSKVMADAIKMTTPLFQGGTFDPPVLTCQSFIRIMIMNYIGLIG